MSDEALLYDRVSSKDQKDEGWSLDAQEMGMTEKAEQGYYLLQPLLDTVIIRPPAAHF